MKIPWSKISMYVVSLFFGIAGGFLLVWQNLKRINKPEEARKFFIWGGLITVITTFLVIKFQIKYGYTIGFFLAVWFNHFYLDKWMKENPNIKPRFGWSMVGWGILGAIVSVIFAVIIILLEYFAHYLR